MFRTIAPVAGLLLAVLLLAPAPSATAESDSAEVCWIDIETLVETCEPREFRPGADDTPEDILEKEIAQIEAQAGGRVIFIGFDHTNLRGPNIKLRGSSSCDGDREVEIGYTSLGRWDNRLNSGVGRARCQFKVFEHTYWRGASYGYFGIANSLGLLNNEASSMTFR